MKIKINPLYRAISVLSLLLPAVLFAQIGKTAILADAYNVQSGVHPSTNNDSLRHRRGLK